MSIWKKWTITYLSIAVTVVIALGVFNLIIDPYGVFGLDIVKVGSYDMQNNERTAKFTYLEKNHDKFDSYIIGGSKAGALIPSLFNQYYPKAKFYNYNMVGGKFFDYQKVINYLVKNYKVKNIVFQISMLELDQLATQQDIGGRLHGKMVSDFPVSFYSKYIFMNPKYSFDKLSQSFTWNDAMEKDFLYRIWDGALNRRKLEAQISKNPKSVFNIDYRFPANPPKLKSISYKYNLQALRNIVNLCKDNNVNLLVVAAPTYKSEFEAYSKQEISQYIEEMSQVTSFWNFSGYNSINNDVTNFYDYKHYREKIAKLILARIFNDTKVKVPEDFGTYVTKDNVEDQIEDIVNPASVTKLADQVVDEALLTSKEIKYKGKTLKEMSLKELNTYIDPFGVFGSNFGSMQSFNLQNNDRIPKITFLDKKHDMFDSYLLGGSKTAAILPSFLKKYYPKANFYNLNMFGGKFYDYEKTLNYLVKHYKVKNIVLQISLLELIKLDTGTDLKGRLDAKVSGKSVAAFKSEFMYVNKKYAYEKAKAYKTWGPQAIKDFPFRIWDGSYNRVRLENIIKKAPNYFFNTKYRFPKIIPKYKVISSNYNLEVLKRMVKLCKAKKINLKVIAAPTYKQEFEAFPQGEVENFLKGVAKIAKFWNFSGINSISSDKKNFYDYNHYRVNVAQKMLARIFNDKSVWVPKDFGKLEGGSK
ncbi:MAG: hypothetical protein WCQ41_07215 [Bacillota bacterium]